MENDLEKMIIECGKNIQKRKEIFYQMGQKYLKPLKDRALEEKTFEVFQLIIKHEKDWKGEILIPQYYRWDKNKSIFKDIWYTLREYFAWSVLYPNEVDNYFKHNENGKEEVLGNPKVRIMDKDNFKQVTKIENGKQVVVNVKKDKSFLIESGFILSQKDSILNVCIAGLLEANPQQKKVVEKPAKNPTKKQELSSVDNKDNIEITTKNEEKIIKSKKVATKKISKDDSVVENMDASSKKMKKITKENKSEK